MINVNELKIGNLAYKSLKSGNGRKLIARIGCSDFERIFEDTTSFNFEPIELTKEWLLKLGFKKRFDFDDCNLYDLVEYTGITKSGLNRGQGFFCIADFIEKEGFWIDLQSRATLKYVHQLQNLFSAITGVELQLSST